VNAFGAPIEQEAEDSTPSTQAPATQFAIHEVLICSEIIWVPEAAIIERVVPSVMIDYLFQVPKNQEAARSPNVPQGERAFMRTV
jgi:hypothetical protein